ncbi:hypothetical protein RVR_3914 [Actinacidiphila reveromycinica]|uniref:Uncharacterized protein n=1 Tax=Actinacidiphila reveromycinica TaxID=659352 RepID=A0A7U3USI7_9ACTN|nr:hypothetical protein [Streptomyces sp. SN-593]BBA97931.1 hypothetical protein RVR_3914 [Streptomyces sp. SN-593]
MGSNDSNPQATVPNPAISDLQDLKRRLIQDLGTLKEPLKTTCSDMGAGTVWVGKAADSWNTDVKGRHGTIKTLLGKLVPVIDAEIKKLPEKVTPGEAKMYHMPD